MARTRISFGVACVLAASACLTPHGPSPSSAFSAPATMFIDGAPARIDLLARKLLVGAEPPPGDFAYYCYLVFGDKARATAQARYGAAAAYLKLLTDVAEVGAAVPPKHMAVLLAPVSDEAAATEVLRDRDVERFLAAYNYDRARLIVNQLERTGHKLPRVAIVGYRTPLEAGGAVDPREVSVVRLDVEDGAVSEERLLKLRDELLSGKAVVNVSGEPVLLEKLRAFFSIIGTTLDKLERVTPA